MLDDIAGRHTLFTRIIAGDIPSHKVHEDAYTFAFLDIGPLSRGHCLLVTKLAYRTLDEVPDDVAAALGAVLPRLCQAVVSVAGAEAYNVLQNNGPAAGQEVEHVHFHIIPKFTDGSGLGLNWPAGSLESEEGRRLAEAIQAAL